jgi:hypothetical protein
LQTDIELKLRLAGIKVDPTVSPNLTVLLLIFNLDRDSAEVVYLGRAAFVNLSLLQDVQLPRAPTIRTAAQTWNSGFSQLWGPPETFADRCRAIVRDLVDEFIDAYLSVNPK